MRTAVIGGGASGMTAALFSARQGESVTVFERSDKILKKLLATGNGRCNLSNTDLSLSNYYTHSPQALKDIMSRFSPEDEKAFFESLGIWFCFEDGRIYPRSQRASAVVDALRFEADRLGINIICNSFVKELRPVRGGFSVCGKFFDRVIISCGGAAAPMFGTDGNSFSLLQTIGHTVHSPSPALVPLKTRENTKSLKGVRARCRVSAGSYWETGEVQFTDYGLSGIPVMQLSRLFTKKNMPICIDCIPEITQTELTAMLFARAELLRGRKAEDFLTGIIHKALSCYILERCNIPRTTQCADLAPREIEKLSQSLKKLSFTVTGVCGWSSAQATCGGAELSEFFPETLESRICPGIYCTGEALDCVGSCGGYNLHWAWLTGFLAGNKARFV